ncbi:MAG: hypothetical protein OXI71_06390 [Gemmatimonadota bacterium]|nr:hypothetical protein [Gemmatimonadota bacterium]
MTSQDRIIAGFVLLLFTSLPLGFDQLPLAQAQELLRPWTEEVFTVGYDDERVFFALITGLAMAEDGTLVVYDSESGSEPAVTVLSPGGTVVAQWGKMGDGPGELDGGGAGVALEGDTVLLAGPLGRMGFYTLEGEELARAAVPPGVYWESCLVNGAVIAWRVVMQIEGPSPGFALAFGPGDGRTTWATRSLATLSLGYLRHAPLLARLPGERLAVGFGDEYALYLVAAESGDTLGLIAREVQQRSEADSDAFIERALDYSTRPDEAPEGWSSLVSPFLGRLGGYDTPLPLIRKAFWGPPGALWVERGPGLQDEHAASLDRPDDSLLWDIFDVNDDHTSEYLGAVALPSGFRVVAANAERVAGVVMDDVGRHAVRVFRVTMPAILER